MDIRLLREEEIDHAVAVMSGNYPDHPEYADNARIEIAAMFVPHPVQPRYIVAEEDGKLIGFAGIAPSWFDYGVWEILWVNVVRDHQGRGIGSALVQKLIDIARTEKRDMIILSCTQQKFYERFGFTFLSALPHDYTLMALNL